MKIKIIDSLKTICSNETGMHKYFGWPSVARLQDGSLAMVASGFRLSHICPFGKLIMCRSYDEGKTWTAPEILMDTPLDDRDGGICTFGDKGVIVCSFNNHVDFQRNYQGESLYRKAYLDEVEKAGDFEKYLGSTIAISNDGGKTFGDIKIVPISSPHGPCELSDGTILYVGRIFNDHNRPTHLECHTMTPDGETKFLSKIEDVSPEVLSCEPHAIQLPSGRILVHIRVQGGPKQLFTIYQSVSDDMGKTFSKPVKLLADNGGSPAHLINHSSGATVSVYGYRTVPFGIRAMFSYDDGNTWDTDNVILDQESSGDLGYPASVELEDGNILTVLYTHEPGKPHTVIRQIIWNFEK